MGMLLTADGTGDELLQIQGIEHYSVYTFDGDVSSDVDESDVDSETEAVAAKAGTEAGADDQCRTQARLFKIPQDYFSLEIRGILRNLEFPCQI